MSARVHGDDAVLSVLQTLWSVDHGLQTMSKHMESTLDVTGPQRLVVLVVGRNPGICASDIADALSLHPSTVSGILHRLEVRGRIARRADPADRRRARFELTDAGRAIYDAKEGTVEAVVARVLETTPPSEREAAVAVLVRLSTALAAAST